MTRRHPLPPRPVRSPATAPHRSRPHRTAAGGTAASLTTPRITEGIAVLVVAADGSLRLPAHLVADLGLAPGDEVTVDALFGEHLALTPVVKAR